MNKVNEATSNGGKIFLSGWFRWSLAFAGAVLLSTLGFSVKGVIANANNISVLQSQYQNIDKDLDEIKSLLRRAIP